MAESNQKEDKQALVPVVKDGDDKKGHDIFSHFQEELRMSETLGHIKPDSEIIQSSNTKIDDMNSKKAEGFLTLRTNGLDSANQEGLLISAKESDLAKTFSEEQKKDVGPLPLLDLSRENTKESLTNIFEDEENVESPRIVIMEETPRLPPKALTRQEIQTPFVNIVVIGHVNAGKSTLTGHLVYLQGAVDQATVRRMGKEAEMMGKSSYKYAWIMDKLKAERQRGMSIDSKLRRFHSSYYHVNIIDTPGHRDYVHNMITGASQADVALLVVSADEGEFESGVRKRGQAREHLHLAYSVGVKQLIVAINKMDTTEPPYSQARFDFCAEKILLLAKKCGFDADSVICLPVSAFHGENIVKPSDKMPWFKMWVVSRHSGSASGKTLLDAIDNIDPPIRIEELPLRIPVHSVYKLGNIGIVTAGRIHTGSVRPGMDVRFSPSGIKAKVRAVQLFREVVDEGQTGDNVGLQLEGVSLNDIKRGDVCGDAYDDPPQKVDHFTAQILVLNHPGYIKKGYTPVIQCHTTMVACKVVDIRERTDRRSGETAEDFPVSLSTGQIGVVDFVPTRPVCLECFFDYPTLGRIIIRDMKQTVAVGVIIHIEGRTLLRDNLKRENTDWSAISNWMAVNFGAMSGKISRRTMLASRHSTRLSLRTPMDGTRPKTRPKTRKHRDRHKSGIDRAVPDQRPVYDREGVVTVPQRQLWGARTFTTLSGKLETEL